MEINESLYEEINKRKIGFNGLVGIKIDEIAVGSGTCSLMITDNHLNPAGTLHGGVLFTMLDVASGLSGMVKENGTRSLVTQCADIHFLKAAKGKKLIAKGTLIKDGRNTAVVRADAFSDDGTLVATGTFDMFYTDKGNGIKT